MWRRFPWREYLVSFILILALLGLIARLVQLNVIERHFLLQQSDARIVRVDTLSAHRGMITDQLGTVLALSTPTYSVWINPKYFSPTLAQLEALSLQLQIPVSVIEARAKYKK